MSVYTSCSWCHTINRTSERWCKTCGHSAFLPRLDCDCPKCMGVLFVDVLDFQVKPETLPLPRAVRQLLGDRDIDGDQEGDDDREGDHA